jgi:hypothetical protein
VELIADDAFFGCVGLTSLTIPSTVASIGEGAFAHCNYLKSVTVLNPVPPYIGYGAFDPLRTCLYVPANSINAYRAAEGWRGFECVKPLAAAPSGVSGE